MFQQIIEFVSNHYMLVSSFLILAILLVIHEKKRGGRNVSSRELTALVNNDAAVVVDVRNAKDFASGHIVDSIHIPSDKLQDRIGELDKYKDKTLVVVCASGMSAGACCATLKKAGFDTVRLSGGIGGWRADGLPTVKKK